MNVEKEILTRYRNIAIVGASPDPERHSNKVFAYLRDNNYWVVPVNPTVDKVLERQSYPDLASVPGPIEVVNVFRASDKVMPIVDEAIAVGAKVLWLQEGVINEAAAAKAREAGLTVIMDRCIAKAHAAMAGKKH
ncbi:CoA-binding protein [Dehalogenimonas sp. THU2]|uniref:CoA-binding protein n=1 Tax=Dehalogenimonas sp. THU2 TaxID=3151121 RepID=UPI0032188BD0